MMNLYTLPLLACATCVETSKNDTSATSNAAGWSIFFLLGVILPVMGAVIFFMVRMARRSAANLEPEFRDVEEGPAIPAGKPAAPITTGVPAMASASR